MTPSWLFCATIILLAVSVSARPQHHSTGPSYLEFPSLQAFAPRRFIKISKRRQYPILTDYDPYLDLIGLSDPPPSPFHSFSPLEEEEQSFSRRQRNAEEDSRAAEDYYNDWIMSNVG